MKHKTKNIMSERPGAVPMRHPTRETKELPNKAAAVLRTGRASHSVASPSTPHSKTYGK